MGCYLCSVREPRSFPPAASGVVVRRNLSGFQPHSQDQPSLLLWGILRSDLHLPPRGSSAAATAIWQLGGVRVRHSTKSSSFLQKYWEVLPLHKRRQSLPQCLSQAPHSYSPDWVNYRHFHSLTFTFGPASFCIPDLQNYLTGLLKIPPAYQFSGLILSQHIT